jgi:hypothetical protein
VVASGYPRWLSIYDPDTCALHHAHPLTGMEWAVPRARFSIFTAAAEPHHPHAAWAGGDDGGVEEDGGW